MMKTLLVITVIVSLAGAKVYTKCGLAKELEARDFPRTFLGNWICLVESESAKDTSKVTERANGGKGLGLFQIDSKEWCTFDKAGGKCDMKCEDLINEDISDDSRCAKKVFNQKGFQAWSGWRRSCYRRQLAVPVC